MFRKEHGYKKDSGYLMSYESVTQGHPDKVADTISDTILEECLKQDKKSRVAVETLVTEDYCIVCGEVTTTAKVDYEEIVRNTIKEIGYVYPELGFSYDTCKVDVKIHEQSPDIAMGVDKLGAGDQGIMFGGACNETKDFMPLGITIARALTDKITKEAKDGTLPIYFDGKSQVTIRYKSDGSIDKIDTVVVSVHHKPHEKIADLVKEYIIKPVLKDYGYSIDDVSVIFINPTGAFLKGGPAADTGLTGRKIVVDTYGGYFAVGGGAFSGKDPTKVDRSGAYMARYIAKNIVGAGLADKVEVQIAYAIGVEKPVSVNLRYFGTQHVKSSLIHKAVFRVFDMTPYGIINTLGLTDGVPYSKCASYGHFGSFVEGLPWERLDKVDVLKSFVKDYEINK